LRVTVHGGNGIHPQTAGKTALCLCGGGITGALFEIGVLAGLGDAMDELNANAFDVYVGSSAGATVASVLSQGVKPERIFGALRNPHDPFFPLRREDVYGAEVQPWIKSLAHMMRGAIDVLFSRLVDRKHKRLLEELAKLHYHLPAGVFRLDRYIRFLCSFFEREGLSNHFRHLRRELYIVANDVDSAERVVFGSGMLRDVEIAVAVAASSAIPIFFEPIRIGDRDYFDGAIGRVDHIDVAIAHGATRILVVNPVVPIRVRGCRLRSRGLLPIGNQAMRIMNKARLHLGMKRYLAEHPHVQVVLVEPSEEDALMFVNGSMSLAARTEILDYAREGALRSLRKFFDEGRSRECWITRHSTEALLAG
jgi:NTE family protein